MVSENKILFQGQAPLQITPTSYNQKPNKWYSQVTKADNLAKI